MRQLSKKMLFVVLILAAALPALMPSAAQAKKSKIPLLRMATTTSTVDSGLLDYLLPFFEKEFKVKMEVISVGTGNAIKLGQSGDVDVILVHARSAEDQFVADGYGVNRRDVMHNDFLIVGPKSNPDGLKKDDKAADAFNIIAEKQTPFISRGDKSGTDIKEKEIWKAAGITPSGKWFLESGQGMGATLTMADEIGAYTLVDRATFIAYAAKVKLAPAVEGDPGLFNPYGVIAVNPKKSKYVKYDLAMKFVGWITSDAGQKLIGEYKVKGVQLFIPDAK
jgi:tungstate transport system substrate-binding protein